MKKFYFFVIAVTIAAIAAVATAGPREQKRIERAVALKKEDIRYTATNRSISFLEDQIILLEKNMEGGIRQYRLLWDSESPEILRHKMISVFRSPHIQQEVYDGVVGAMNTILFYSSYAEKHGKLDNEKIQKAKFLRSSQTDEGKELRAIADTKRQKLLKSVDEDLSKADNLTWSDLSPEEQKAKN